MRCSPFAGRKPFNQGRNSKLARMRGGWEEARGGRERSVKSFNARASNVVSSVLVMKNIITPARISHALCTSCSRIPDATPKDTRTYVRLLLLLLARGNPVTVIYVTTFFPNSPRPLRQQPGHLDKKFDNSLYRALLQHPPCATPPLKPIRGVLER